MTVWIRVDGYPATEIAAHTPPTWETWADGGCGSASWEFALTARSQHQALRAGNIVEILCGPMPIWAGTLTDPDRTTWQCTAYGFAADGKNYLSLDGGGANTRDVGAAITEAIARGWRVSNPSGISGTSSGTAAANPISMSQLLDEFCAQGGQRWGVDGARRLYVRSDPTSASWVASPGAAAFGSTTEDRAGRLYGRFLNSATSLYATAIVGAGTEMPVDLSDRGAMTQAQAEAILSGMLTRDHDGPAWTNGVTLSREQIQTAGGTPAFLPAVRAGQMMRAHGLSNAVNALALDVVIGKTRYTAGEDTIYVEPVNTAPRNAVDVWAA